MPLALLSALVTPEVKPLAVPVKFVATPDAGVPSAGVTRVGEFAKTRAPLPVSSEITPASCVEVVAANAQIADGVLPLRHAQSHKAVDDAEAGCGTDTPGGVGSGGRVDVEAPGRHVREGGSLDEHVGDHARAAVGQFLSIALADYGAGGALTG